MTNYIKFISDKERIDLDIRDEHTTLDFFDTDSAVLFFSHWKFLEFAELIEKHKKRVKASFNTFRKLHPGVYDNTPNASKSNEPSEVCIYIPESIELFEGEDITNEVGEFMEALGFELEVKNEPIIHSFWRKLKFVFKRHVTADQIDDVFSKGKRALELRHVEVPTADQTEKLALAAQRMVSTLERFEEGVVRLGAIIVIKKKVKGKPKLVIEQLSHELIAIFDKQPQLLRNLQTTYELVTGDVDGKEYDESGAVGAVGAVAE